MMDMVKQIKEKFGKEIENIYFHNERRIYLDLKNKAVIREMARYLFYDLGLRFNIASGVDCRGWFEILYHFSDDAKGRIITVRVKVNKDDPQIDSIAPIFKAAEWIEREMWELLGINFVGHPNLKRLLLAEDWPGGKFPLRQEKLDG